MQPLPGAALPWGGGGGAAVAARADTPVEGRLGSSLPHVGGAYVGLRRHGWANPCLPALGPGPAFPPPPPDGGRRPHGVGGAGQGVGGHTGDARAEEVRTTRTKTNTARARAPLRPADRARGDGRHGGGREWAVAVAVGGAPGNTPPGGEGERGKMMCGRSGQRCTRPAGWESQGRGRWGGGQGGCWRVVEGGWGGGRLLRGQYSLTAPRHPAGIGHPQRRRRYEDGRRGWGAGRRRPPRGLRVPA